MVQKISTLAVVLLAVFSVAASQQTSASVPDGEKTLAATMGVYVFPVAGQDESQQSREEGECFAWASKTTQSDPFDLAKRLEQSEQVSARQKEQAARASQGGGAESAVKGAAVGALIGEIASNDAGGGAAWGAAAGLLGNRRAKRKARARAEQEIDAEAQAREEASLEQIEAFKKAFGVCLEAKNYMVRM